MAELVDAIPQHQFTSVLKKHAPALSETSCLRPPKLCLMPALNKLECTLHLLKRMQSCCYSDDFRFLNSITKHRHISFFMAKQDFYCELSCSDSTSPCRLWNAVQLLHGNYCITLPTSYGLGCLEQTFAIFFKKDTKLWIQFHLKIKKLSFRPISYHHFVLPSTSNCQ
jgi:hypothetical protein